MPTATMYRQAREDGAVRTGIDVEGDTVLQYYQAESAESDPALLWYIDVRCSGEAIPRDPEEIRGWFLSHAEFFKCALRAVADQQLAMGFDAELRPYRKQLAGPPPGAEVVLYVSAVRRLIARDLAEEVRQLADAWEQIVLRLAPLSPV